MSIAFPLIVMFIGGFFYLVGHQFLQTTPDPASPKRWVIVSSSVAELGRLAFFVGLFWWVGSAGK